METKTISQEPERIDTVQSRISDARNNAYKSIAREDYDGALRVVSGLRTTLVVQEVTASNQPTREQIVKSFAIFQDEISAALESRGYYG